MANLITLDTLKIALGEPLVADPEDAKHSLAIASASSLIRNYTGLQFDVSGSSPVASPRRYEYDGSGFLDIDECQAITSVTTESGYSGMPASVVNLSVNEWSAYPLNGPVKLWLRLAENYYGVGSPEMGFTYNLDTLAYKYPFKPNIITVTATWGWATIPDDVQQAVIWTALNLAESPRPYTQESIENYSRTRGASDTEEPIPLRAQAILQNYIIPRV